MDAGAAALSTAPPPVALQPATMATAAVAPLTVTASSPATAPSPVPAAFGEELRRCILAFGAAIDASDQRRTRDALHVLLTAQQENQAMFMQALGDVRHEYTDNLGRAVERLVERMAEELTPASVMGLGSLFRDSANEITASARRGERLQGRILEILGGLGEGLERLSEQVQALRTHLASSPQPRDEPDLPRRPLAGAKSSVRPAPQRSLLEQLSDDPD
jgi:hypothetical protein